MMGVIVFIKTTKKFHKSMKHKKKLIIASQIILTMSYPIAVKPESMYSFDAILRSSIDEPAFIYKASACQVFDSIMAESESKKTGKKRSSVLLKGSGKDKFVRGLIDIYSVSEINEAVASPNFDKFKYLFDPNGDYDTKKQVEVCQKAMLSVLTKYLTKNRTTSKAPGSSSLVNSHKNCLEARDYEGCMRFKKDGSASKGEEKCTPEGWCMAKKGIDSLGFPKKVGYLYMTMDSGSILYMNPVTKRIPHKGDPARYLAIEMIWRYYKNPTSGTPGSQTTIGSSRTNCTGYGVSISCTTTPPTVISTPGTSGSPGGNRSVSRVSVLDCKDKTTATYERGKLYLKWKKADSNDEELIKNKCPILSTFPVLNMKL